jgi:hypothetical protein
MKNETMPLCLESVRDIMRIAHPDKYVRLEYMEETEESVAKWNEWYRKYHNIRPGQQNIYIFDEDGLLYKVDVTWDSTLTAIHELMELIARKF